MGVFNNFPYANFHELNADWIIEQVRKVMDEWEEYKTDMDLWKLGVDNQLAEFQVWFDNLDVQDEIRVVMNELVASGEFLTITTPQINAAVEAWLAAHITPTTPAVDNTLTISGAAADAKVTGNRIDLLKEDVKDEANGIYPINSNYYKNSYIDSTGALVSLSNWKATDFIYCKGLSSIHFLTNTVQTIYNAFYSSNNETDFISRFTVPVGSSDISVPENAEYFRISNGNNGFATMSFASLYQTEILDSKNSLKKVNESLKDFGPYFNGE